MPLQNMPFRYKDYFELKVNKKKQTQQKLSALDHPSLLSLTHTHTRMDKIILNHGRQI